MSEFSFFQTQARIDSMLKSTILQTFGASFYIPFIFLYYLFKCPFVFIQQDNAVMAGGKLKLRLDSRSH